jgi:hypothetical protein
MLIYNHRLLPNVYGVHFVRTSLQAASKVRTTPPMLLPPLRRLLGAGFAAIGSRGTSRGVETPAGELATHDRMDQGGWRS